MPAPAVVAVGRAIARRAAARRAGRCRGGGEGPKFILGLLVLVGALIVGAPLALMLMLAPMLGGEENTASAEPPTCDPATGVATGSSSAVIADDVGGLSEEQMGNAETIVETGQQLEVPTYGWVIALATAMQESTLINVDHGDNAGPDSRGLFQQRAPWGSEEDRMDPASATEFFFTGGEGGQPGLLDIDGWEDMQVTEAAQAVQRSAYPDAYAQHEPLAKELVEQIGDQDPGGGDDCGPPPSQCPPTDLPQEDEDLTPDALIVLRCTAQDYPEIETYHGIGDRPANPDSDHPSGRAIDAMIPNWDTRSGNELGSQIASWTVDNATEMGVKYVIWDGQIWSDERSDEGWRDYSHPSGAGDPTSAHEDHVHVSVYGDAAVLPDTGDWALPIEEGDYELTARFGESGSSWTTTHTGLDFAATTGTPVMAAGGGEVTYMSTDVSAWHGNMVEITHGDGVVTVYAHLDEIAPGTIGADVQPGTVIGYVGETGNANGAHLHLETQIDGSPRDPEAWLESYGLDP